MKMLILSRTQELGQQLYIIYGLLAVVVISAITYKILETFKVTRQILDAFNLQ